MSVNITLNYIRENWSSATQMMERRDFCLSVLPDAYDHRLCRSQGSDFFREDSGRHLSYQTINGLMRGNRKSASDPAPASAAFTKDFLHKLVNNAPIVYLDPQRPADHCVENMCAKIRAQVRDHYTPRNREHPLFARLDFGVLEVCDETVRNAYRKLQLAVHSLLERETEASLSYAIFLLVITAILQDRITLADRLFSAAAIDALLENDADGPLLETGNRRHIPFTDPNYMNTYHLYFYHDTTHDLFRRGTLTMTPDGLGRSAASLTVENVIESPVSGRMEVERKYTGRPILSQTERIVHITMTDEKSHMIYLTFPYTPFNFAPMYFRSALLVSTGPDSKLPLAQRVAIVARELTKEELPYVRGLLKTGGRQILLSEKQMAHFMEAFADYDWMADFRANYKPLLELHRRSFYCFDEDEILSCSNSELTYPDRLRVMLALKSVDVPTDQTLHKFLSSAVPSKTYAIMK